MPAPVLEPAAVQQARQPAQQRLTVRLIDVRRCCAGVGSLTMSFGLTDSTLLAYSALNTTDQRVFNWGILEPHNGSPINWQYLFFLFKNISPYFWCTIGIGQCVGLSILGASW